jgi:hypothetical protein
MQGRLTKPRDDRTFLSKGLAPLASRFGAHARQVRGAALLLPQDMNV